MKEKGEERKQKESKKQKSEPRLDFGRSQKALDGLAGVLDVEVVGDITGILYQKSHTEEKHVADAELAAEQKIHFEKSGVTADDIQALQDLIGASSEHFPEGFDAEAVYEVLSEKKQQLHEAEQAKMRQEEERAHAAAFETYQKKQTRKRRVRSGVAVVATGIFATGAAYGLDMWSKYQHDQAISYEKQHELTNGPSDYSTSGWRVSYPAVERDTLFAVPSETIVTIQPAEEDGTVKFTDNQTEVDTGISFEEYERVDTDEQTPKIHIKDGDDTTQEKLIATRDNARPYPDVVLFENTNGRKILVEVKDLTNPKGNFLTGSHEPIFVFSQVVEAKSPKGN